MKKVNILGLIVLFALVSCNNSKMLDANTPAKQNASKKTFVLTPNTFDFIGESHNEGLDYVFDNVIKNNTKITYNDVNNASIEYVSKVNEYFKLTEGEIAKLQRELQSEENKKFMVAALSQKALSVDFLKKYVVLTPNQEQFIIELSEFVNDDKLPLNETLNGIVKLELNAIEKFGEDEIIDVLCLASIAKHSLNYWSLEVNQKKWLNVGVELGYLDDDKPMYVNWHAVAVADILGFGAGFPSGVTVGMVAGGLAAGVYTGGAAAGIGAVLGGFVGGCATGLAKATMASAAVLIAEWIADLFGI